jgi:hypothetical protein
MLSRHLNLLTEYKTIDIVQRGVLGLAGFSPSRNLFRKDISIIGPSWATVLDEAWEDFSDTPPTALSVVVTDGPGDKDLRVWSKFEFVWIADLVIR